MPTQCLPTLSSTAGGSRENYLVIEFKKSTNRVDREIDLAKLRGYKEQLAYSSHCLLKLGQTSKLLLLNFGGYNPWGDESFRFTLWNSLFSMHVNSREAC